MLRRQRRRCTESSTRACDFGSCPWTRADGSLHKEPSSPQRIAYRKTPRRSRIRVTPSRPRANAAVCPAGARELHNASARRARVSAPSAHGIGLRHARARRSRYRQHATEKHDTLNAERLATAQSANCCDVQNCAEREPLVKDWERVCLYSRRNVKSMLIQQQKKRWACPHSPTEGCAERVFLPQLAGELRSRDTIQFRRCFGDKKHADTNRSRTTANSASAIECHWTAL